MFVIHYITKHILYTFQSAHILILFAQDCLIIVMLFGQFLLYVINETKTIFLVH